MTRKDYLLLSDALYSATLPTAGFTDEERKTYLYGVRLAAYAIGDALARQSGGFNFDQFMNDAGFKSEAQGRA